MAFKSVEVTRLQAAFALAHQAGEDSKTPAGERGKFKAIAALLWRACGERTLNPPRGSGAKLLDRPAVKFQSLLADPASKPEAIADCIAADRTETPFGPMVPPRP